MEIMENVEAKIRIDAAIAEKDSQIKSVLHTVCMLRGDNAVLSARIDALLNVIKAKDAEIAALAPAGTANSVPEAEEAP